MIKLYKGTEGLNKEDTIQLKAPLSGKKDRKNKNDPLFIDGWYNETEEFDPIGENERT